MPVDREPGLNTANVVVGLVTNHTAKVPEGDDAGSRSSATRPTGLGNLAEPECRRIIAALDLAERLRVPVEWFAVSSGALIAMDSGTENMDWIAAVLRGLIEFTQARRRGQHRGHRRSTSAASRTGTPRRRCSCTPGASSS